DAGDGAPRRLPRPYRIRGAWLASRAGRRVPLPSPARGTGRGPDTRASRGVGNLSRRTPTLRGVRRAGIRGPRGRGTRAGAAVVPPRGRARRRGMTAVDALAGVAANASAGCTVDLCLVSHTNAGKTTLTRTLLGRDIGEVRDRPHVTEVAEAHVLLQTPQGD